MSYLKPPLLFIFLSVLFSCQESSKKEETRGIQENIDTLSIQKIFREKYNTLNKTHTVYKQKYAELEVQNGELKEDVALKGKEIQKLRVDRKVIAKKLQEKINKITLLKENLKEYKDKYDKGELTEDEFGSILDDYEEVHATLDDENKAFQALAQQNEDLEAQVQQQSDEIELSRNQVNAVTPVKEFSLYYYRSKNDKKKKLRTPLTADAEHASTLVKEAIYLDIGIDKDLMYYQQGVWEINDQDAGVKVFATLFEEGKNAPLHNDQLILDEKGKGNLELKNVGLTKGTSYHLELSIGNKVLKKQKFSIQ